MGIEGSSSHPRRSTCRRGPCLTSRTPDGNPPNQPGAFRSPPSESCCRRGMDWARIVGPRQSERPNLDVENEGVDPTITSGPQEFRASILLKSIISKEAPKYNFSTLNTCQLENPVGNFVESFLAYCGMCWSLKRVGQRGPCRTSIPRFPSLEVLVLPSFGLPRSNRLWSPTPPNIRRLPFHP